MISDQCVNCKHYLGLKQCEAFPEKIPDEIFYGEFDHVEPFEGDNGIRFEQISKTNKGDNG